MPDRTSVPFIRRFWPPLALGLVGVASLPLVMLPTLRMLVRTGQAHGMSLSLLTALSLIQPVLLVVAGAAVGALLAPRLGFASHAARVNVGRRFASELPLAVSSAVIAGAVIVGVDVAFFREANALSANAAPRAIVDGLVSGVLYGGLSEEVMMRWGLMSFVAWAGMRLFARGAATMPRWIGVASIVTVALLFAAGHLPAVAMTTFLTPAVVARVLLLNAVAGLLFGWLFWRRSLEAAMMAHASMHVVFAAAQLLGWR